MSLKSYLEIKLAELIKCTICWGEYVEPKMLKCQHVFCCQCLQDYVNSFDYMVFGITCPLCRSFTNLKGKDINCLPNSLNAQNLGQILKEYRTSTALKPEGVKKELVVTAKIKIEIIEKAGTSSRNGKVRKKSKKPAFLIAWKRDENGRLQRNGE